MIINDNQPHVHIGHGPEDLSPGWESWESEAHPLVLGEVAGAPGGSP
jgi:hypothetical protein